MNAPLQNDSFSAMTQLAAGTTTGLARETYDQLRSVGLSDTDIMAFAGELLTLVATDVRERPPQS